MTLFGDIKRFLKQYFSNPLTLAATAFIVWKILRKHNPKEAARLCPEGLRILKTKGDQQLVMDLDTGKKFWAGDTDFKLVEHSERLTALSEQKASGSGFPIDEFLLGLKVEHEHEDAVEGDPIKIAKIVLDHLDEDSEYYSKLSLVHTERKLVFGDPVLYKGKPGVVRRNLSGGKFDISMDKGGRIFRKIDQTELKPMKNSVDNPDDPIFDPEGGGIEVQYGERLNRMHESRFRGSK